MDPLLISLIVSLVEGESLAAVLEGWTLTQWLTLAAGVSADLLPLIEKKLAPKHPSIAAMVQALANDLGIPAAASAGNDWWSNWRARQPQTMPGYASDGSVIEIPNPDYKGN